MEIDFADLGITKVSTTSKQFYQGQLPLPKEFDRRTNVGKWSYSGADLQRAEEAEVAPGGYKIPGWQVWKDGAGRPYEKLLGKGKVILLFRPRRVQHARNLLYGRESRRRINGEMQGDTVAGEGQQDPRMMTNALLSRVEGEPVTTFAEPILQNPHATTDAAVETPIKARR